jgi:hypothetical protein
MRLSCFTKERQKQFRTFVKDFGGHIVGCLALVVSSFALYQNLHVVDDFRFTIGNDNNIPNPDPRAKRIILYGPHLLTFINSGTRPVATLDVQLLVYQSTAKGADPNDCPLAESTRVKTGIEPFVVKAGEIIVQPINFDHTSGAELDEQGRPILILKDNMYRTVLCLMFDLATPDNVPSQVIVPLTSSEYSTPPYGGTDIFYTPSKPIRLLPR